MINFSPTIILIIFVINWLPHVFQSLLSNFIGSLISTVWILVLIFFSHFFHFDLFCLYLSLSIIFRNIKSKSILNFFLFLSNYRVNCNLFFIFGTANAATATKILARFSKSCETFSNF